MLKKQQKRQRRHRRVRAKVKGTAKVPRLCVFRSAKHIYAQLVDDEKGKTILSLSDLKLKIPKTSSKEKKISTDKKLKEEKVRTKKIAVAYEVGKSLAKKAIEKKIKKVIFDRGGYKYHGRVKAVAEGAREEGLIF